MTLEEYIVKRKREDGINEYDLEKRLENTRICVNYIFEYFNNYLDSKPVDEKTVLHEQKVDKYRHIVREYNPEVREWLVSIYSSHGKYMHKQLMNLITDDYFLLYDSEAEFRALSYDIYPKAIKRFKFLDGQSEMVFQFVKEAHRIRNSFYPYDSDFYISDSVNEWIFDTYNKHGVNVYNFCYEWAHYFFECPEMWPKGHKLKSEYYDKRSEYKGISLSESFFWDYDYRQKSNLFCLDSLYRSMPKKSFIKGRKQEFEAVLLYCWLHGVTSDDEYWNEYSQQVL
ncbi:hypothetical protein CE91St41_26020 [Oscillospiraceae bacterium]|nr:hypothetical protein CE91St40_11520 [Oscillospiraceae bacterium]BDF75713.1 hypothetical protein CE91St41_26020 [Oscillospiraceae bacterium]